MDETLDDALVSAVKSMKGPKLNIRFDTRYKVMNECAKSLGWTVVTDERDHASIEWVDAGGQAPEAFGKLNVLQKINHFPSMPKICQKCQLGNILNRMSKEFPDLYDFHPRTWTLPKDRETLKLWWQDQFNSRKARPTLIVKPDGGCQGRGIFLTSDINKACEDHGAVAIQTYIMNPLLVNGYKFDLRIYATVTSCSPRLRAFRHKAGLVRFCTQKFARPDKNNLEDQYMHLTNYAVNKKNSGTAEAEPVETKWSLEKLYQHLASQGHDIEKLENEFDAVIAKTLLSIQSNLAQEYQAFFSNEGSVGKGGGFRCFEVLGFDIMLDSHLKAWIIEVNHSPSFHCDSPLDHEVKYNLLRESFLLASIDVDDLVAGQPHARPRTVTDAKNQMLELVNQRRNESSTSNNKPRLSISQLEQLRTVFEDANIGGFRRILPVDQSSPFYDDCTKILSYQPQLLRENPGAKMRRLVLEEERKMVQQSKLEDLARCGDRPVWGTNHSLPKRPSSDGGMRQRQEVQPKKKEDSGSESGNKLPRVAMLPIASLSKTRAKPQRVETAPVSSVDRICVPMQTWSFGGEGGFLPNINRNSSR